MTTGGGTGTPLWRLNCTMRKQLMHAQQMGCRIPSSRQLRLHELRCMVAAHWRPYAGGVERHGACHNVLCTTSHTHHVCCRPTPLGWNLETTNSCLGGSSCIACSRCRGCSLCGVAGSGGSGRGSTGSTHGLVGSTSTHGHVASTSASTHGCCIRGGHEDRVDDVHHTHASHDVGGDDSSVDALGCGEGDVGGVDVGCEVRAWQEGGIAHSVGDVGSCDGTGGNDVVAEDACEQGLVLGAQELGGGEVQGSEGLVDGLVGGGEDGPCSGVVQGAGKACRAAAGGVKRQAAQAEMRGLVVR